MYYFIADALGGNTLLVVVIFPIYVFLFLIWWWIWHQFRKKIWRWPHFSLTALTRQGWRFKSTISEKNPKFGQFSMLREEGYGLPKLHFTIFWIWWLWRYEHEDKGTWKKWRPTLLQWASIWYYYIITIDQPIFIHSVTLTWLFQEDHLYLQITSSLSIGSTSQ